MTFAKFRRVLKSEFLCANETINPRKTDPQPFMNSPSPQCFSLTKWWNLPKQADEAKKRTKCTNCKLTFSNEWAMTQHSKFKHKSIGDKKNIQKLISLIHHLQVPSRKEATKNAKSRKSQLLQEKKAKTIFRRSNEKKSPFCLTSKNSKEMILWSAKNRRKFENPKKRKL
jgi:hypothetical protein